MSHVWTSCDLARQSVLHALLRMRGELCCKFQIVNVTERTISVEDWRLYPRVSDNVFSSRLSLDWIQSGAF